MSAFSPRELFFLDEACKPIVESLGVPFLVGTASDRSGGYRDVDIRLILPDKKYKKLRKAVGKRGIVFMGLSIGEYLASRTGLPIDFQIQQQTAANHHHPEKRRNPMGLRSLINYQGDAPLIDKGHEDAH